MYILYMSKIFFIRIVKQDHKHSGKPFPKSKKKSRCDGSIAIRSHSGILLSLAWLPCLCLLLRPGVHSALQAFGRSLQRVPGNFTRMWNFEMVLVQIWSSTLGDFYSKTRYPRWDPKIVSWLKTQKWLHIVWIGLKVCRYLEMQFQNRKHIYIYIIIHMIHMYIANKYIAMLLGLRPNVFLL